MRAVVQRVADAEVVVDGEVVGQIDGGLLLYVGAAPDDGPADVTWLAEKIAGLRVFPDADGKINLDVSQAGGRVLAVPAFTTQADARKGRRPSFDRAAPPDVAQPLYEAFCDALTAAGVGVDRGVFRAHMHVRSTNDGPICILLDSKRAF